MNNEPNQPINNVNYTEPHNLSPQNPNTKVAVLWIVSPFITLLSVVVINTISRFSGFKSPIINIISALAGIAGVILIFVGPIVGIMKLSKKK